MKTMKKALLLVALALLAATNPSAHAQEFIKAVDTNLAVTNPIVREWKDSIVMGASNKGLTIGKSWFYLFTETSTTALEEEISVNEIKDFIVVDDHVVFCGSTKYGSKDVGVFGYFDLNQFPNAPVTYVPVSEFKSLHHIVTSRFNDRVMTIYTIGIDTTEQYRIAEARFSTYIPNIPKWTITTTHVIDPTDEYKLQMDDIDLLKKYVVVTARLVPSDWQIDNYELENWDSETSQSPTGYILYFPRNVAYPLSALNSCIYRTYMNYRVMAPFIIEKCDSSWFTVSFLAYKAGAGSIHVGAFNGTGHYCTIGFTPALSDYTLRDMRFNSYSNDLEVLLCTLNNPYQSGVYSLDQTMTSFSGSATGHIYDYKIGSLCYRSNHIDNFVAAGSDWPNHTIPLVFGYHFNVWNIWNNCSEKTRVDTGIEQPLIMGNNISPECNVMIYMEFDAEHSVLEGPIKNRCYSRDTNDNSIDTIDN